MPVRTKCPGAGRATPARQRLLRPWLLAALVLLAPSAQAADARVAEIERALRGNPELALHALGFAMPLVEAADRIDALLVRGNFQVLLPDIAGAQATAAEIETLAHESPAIPLLQAQAAAGLLRAQVLAQTGPVAPADRAAGEALARLPADAPPELRLRFVELQSGFKSTMGQLAQSVALGQQAITLADAGAPLWRRSLQRSTLAWVLVDTNQLERALQLNDEATRMARESGDVLQLSACQTTAGRIYSVQGRRAEELAASQEALDLARQAGADRVIATTLTNMADVYLQRGEYTVALQMAQQALPLARRLKDPGRESVALVNAGLALILLRRHEEGLPLVREGLLIEQRVGGLTAMSGIQLELGLALEKVGRLQDAWAALVEHRRLADQVFQRQHQNALLELQESFDAEQRQRELAMRESEKALKEAQLQRRTLQQGLWVVGVAAGVLLVAVVALLLRRLHERSAALRHTNSQLRVASERDPLTGLSNRRHFLQLMQRQGGRSGAAPVAFEGALLMVDVDNFKRINDQHGHAAGDAVLVELGRRLQQAVREGDLSVRWGGEEFLLLVRDMPPQQVQALAARLLRSIGDEPVAHAGLRLDITASIGFASFPLPGHTPLLGWERAVDLVDTAMYLAKAQGRNRACGVRRLDGGLTRTAADAPAGLEAAWRNGQAELVVLHGPTAAAAAACDPVAELQT